MRKLLTIVASLGLLAGITLTNQACMVGVNAASGPVFSYNGDAWSARIGIAPYNLPSQPGWSTAVALSSNCQTVIAGHSSLGVWKTVDGGVHWRNVSGTGSGLEATTQNAGVFMTTTTAAGTTDLLVGMIGTTNGGIFLSGNLGENWTQINQGFDPNTLSISTLVKTACSGCPVQYYSGSFGGGMYTRTIAVLPPPIISGWCAGANCDCSKEPMSGPFAGGDQFTLCGDNIQADAVAKFGINAVDSEYNMLTNFTMHKTGPCTLGGINKYDRLVCTIPASVGDNTVNGILYNVNFVSLAIYNPDTRQSTQAVDYKYTSKSIPDIDPGTGGQN